MSAKWGLRTWQKYYANWRLSLSSCRPSKITFQQDQNGSERDPMRSYYFYIDLPPSWSKSLDYFNQCMKNFITKVLKIKREWVEVEGWDWYVSRTLGRWMAENRIHCWHQVVVLPDATSYWLYKNLLIHKIPWFLTALAQKWKTPMFLRSQRFLRNHLTE